MHSNIKSSRRRLDVNTLYNNNNNEIRRSRTPKHLKKNKLHTYNVRKSLTPSNRNKRNKMTKSTGRLPSINRNNHKNKGNNHDMSYSTSRLPNVKINNERDDKRLDTEKQNRINKVMERFLRADQYSTMRRLIAANPYMSGYDLKGAIEYGLEKIPPSHLAPTNESISLQATNKKLPEVDVLQTFKAKHELLQKSRDNMKQNLDIETSSSSSTTTISSKSRISLTPTNASNSDESSNISMASTLCELMTNDNNIESEQMFDNGENQTPNVEDWEISNFLKVAFGSETELEVSMAPKYNVLTASYQDFEYSKTTDLNIGRDEIGKLVDDVTNFHDLSPLDTISFTPNNFRDAKPQPTLYQVNHKYTDIVANIVMERIPCERSAVILNNFRPIEEDAAEEEMKSEAAKFTEQRSATVSVALDGTTQLSLWDQRLVPMKTPQVITTQPLDAEQHRPEEEEEEDVKVKEIEIDNDNNEKEKTKANEKNNAQTIENDESKKKSNEGEKASNVNSVQQIVKVEQVDAKETADRILEALMERLSTQQQVQQQVQQQASNNNGAIIQQLTNFFSPNSSPQHSPQHSPLMPTQWPPSPTNSNHSNNGFPHSPSQNSISQNSISVSTRRPEILLKARMSRVSHVQNLLESGTPIDISDEFGNQLIHVASQVGNKKLLKLALRHGACIDAQNHQGQTPLHYLYAYRYEALAEYAISKGAKTNIPNQYGLLAHQGLRPEQQD